MSRVSDAAHRAAAGVERVGGGRVAPLLRRRRRGGHEVAVEEAAEQPQVLLHEAKGLPHVQAQPRS